MKADIQWQRWNVPAVASGEAWSRSTSLGLSYRFAGASLKHHKEKVDPNDPQWHKLFDDYPGAHS